MSSPSDYCITIHLSAACMLDGAFENRKKFLLFCEEVLTSTEILEILN
jgi:hypothetical protein